MHIKTTERYHHIPVRLANTKKNLTTPRVGDNVGKLEFSYTVGNIEWYNYFREQFVVAVPSLSHV